MKNQQQKVGRGYGTRKASDTGIRDKKLGTAGRIDAEGGEEERKRRRREKTSNADNELCSKKHRHVVWAVYRTDTPGHAN